MKDHFANRLGMFLTVKYTVNRPEHVAIWQNQPPLAFGTPFNAFTAALTDLQSFVAEHGQEISGAAVDKKREREELAAAAHQLGSALAAWFRSQSDETNAMLVDRSISAWRRLRDAALLQQTQILLDLAEAVVGGPDAAAAGAYGVTGLSVTVVQDERADYAAIVAAPQGKRAARKALTVQYRDRFNDVEGYLDTLDGLVLQYRTNAAGRAFVAAYQASRIIVDAGSGPGSGGGTEPPTPTPTPPPPTPTPTPPPPGT